MNETIIKPLQELSGTLTELPRGGYIVDTPIGYVQFGSPPETIKDSMMLPKDVPQIFVLTEELFNWMKGISIAEIEFPIYYNFFINKRKTLILCRKNQYTQIKRVLQESIFGPEFMTIKNDFSFTNRSDYIPDVENEIKYFRNNLKFSDMLSFGLFKNNAFIYKGLKIQINEDNNFSVYYNNNKITDVPGVIEYKSAYRIRSRLPEPYKPPLLGITCLGSSHGFDPESNTSGFLLWLNHSGIMVDPPVDSTEWLESSNISSKLIDGIILTHCHADHDAGTFQKILEEEKITLYTTKTVMVSFLRKYSSLTNTTIGDLMKLFNYHPIKIDKPVFIHGAKFKFFYTLHSIPTIGFKMEFHDQSFFYSSDHNNDPSLHKELLDKGLISEKRYDELSNLAWDSNVIYHESGVPPLHTPINYLNSLPKKTQNKIVIYHIAEKDFPKKTNLKLAKFGIENTLYFKASRSKYEKEYQILTLLKNIDFFEDLQIGKAQDFVNIVEEEKFRKGENVIKKGTKGDKFYIIYCGNVSVKNEGLEEKKIYGAYDYFGEVALITKQKRGVDIIAETDVTFYTIERDKFLNFITNTDFERMLHRLIRIRNNETWNLLSTSDFFKMCTSSQKTWLESIFIPQEFTGEGILIKENNALDKLYIIRQGNVEVSKDGNNISQLKKGDFVGSMQKIYWGKNSDFTFSYNDDVSAYIMEKEDLIKFFDKNPGILMKSQYHF